MDKDHTFLLTVDVEDWFQVENLRACVPFSSWASCELRVERNTHLILDLFDSALSGGNGSRASGCAAKATFFVLGWLAKRAPHLVREIAARGHEIASHGYNHNLCSQCSDKDLRRDLSDSKKVLEDITGVSVDGYRAPNFSISPGVLEIINECGYLYDSSYNSFGGNSRYGRLDLEQNAGGIACRVSNTLYEIPISNLEIGNRIMPAGGGGYFRLMPTRLFNRAVRSIMRKQGTYVFYIHPWEVDPDQPKVKELPLSFKFRHYLNLHKTMPKLLSFLNEFKDCRYISCREYLQKVCGT